MGENERAKARATEKEAGRERKPTIKKNPLSEKKVKYKTIKIKKKKREHRGSVYTLSAVGRV